MFLPLEEFIFQKLEISLALRSDHQFSANVFIHGKPFLCSINDDRVPALKLIPIQVWTFHNGTWFPMGPVRPTS
jgi:hypothetical protein